MPNPYDVLGLPLDADDLAVRRRYLELTKQFPPEQHPEKFAAVRAAYEQLKDLDSRTRYRLFEVGADESLEALIEEVACRTPRRRFKLTELLAATAPPR